MGGRLFPERARSQLVADDWGEVSGGEKGEPRSWAVPRLSSPRVARPASVGPGRATTVMGCRTEPGRA
jgi:hypothetical protein